MRTVPAWAAFCSSPVSRARLSANVSANVSAETGSNHSRARALAVQSWRCFCTAGWPQRPERLTMTGTRRDRGFWAAFVCYRNYGAYAARCTGSIHSWICYRRLQDCHAGRSVGEAPRRRPRGRAVGVLVILLGLVSARSGYAADLARTARACTRVFERPPELHEVPRICRGPGGVEVPHVPHRDSSAPERAARHARDLDRWRCRRKSCAACHSDHNGPDFPLVRWQGGTGSLDHRQTGFALTGKHAGLACAACHKAANIAAAARDRHSDQGPGPIVSRALARVRDLPRRRPPWSARQRLRALPHHGGLETGGGLRSRRDQIPVDRRARRRRLREVSFNDVRSPALRSVQRARVRNVHGLPRGSAQGQLRRSLPVLPRHHQLAEGQTTDRLRPREDGVSPRGKTRRRIVQRLPSAWRFQGPSDACALRGLSCGRAPGPVRRPRRSR